MLTGLLRGFLYLILLFIFLWGGALFFGPSALKYAANKYYGEKINFVGLTVSPRLKIYAARIEFDNLTVPNLGKRSGFVRAASLSLKNYRSRKLFFELLTGPVKIDDTAQVASSSTLISIGIFNSSEEIDLAVDLKEFESQDKLSLERLSTELTFNSDQKNLYNLEFEATGIRNNFFKQLSAERASGVIGRVDFGKAFDRSISSFDMVLEKVSIENNFVSLKKVFARGNLESTDPQLNIDLSDLKLRDELIANFINIQRLEDWSTKDQFGLFRYRANGIDLTQLNISPSLPSIKQIDGEIDIHDGGKISLVAQGQLEKFDLVTGAQYIADLAGSEFKIGINLFTYTDVLSVETEFALNVSQDPVMNFDGNLALKLLEQNLFNCLFTGCNFNDLVLNYAFSAGGYSLLGHSTCSEKICSVEKLRHSIKTSDTQRFFSSLIASKVFSPIALIFAQSEFQKGIKVGDGHMLKF